jgi:hypothetical protein
MGNHTPGKWKVLKGAAEGDSMRCAIVVEQGKMQYLLATIENGAPGDFCETEEANAELMASAPAMREELDDLQRTFDLMWAADMRAIKRWQAAHPGNDLTWPDRSKLTEWLLERLSATTARLRAHALSRCPDRQTGATKYTHCDECETRWDGDQPEQHKPCCILSLQQS